MIAVESLVEWQRPSEALPESYKNKIVEESKEQLEALHALAQHISSRLHCGGERRENIPQETIAHVYTDLERLNNGTKRFLNIKMYKQFLIYSQAEECKDSFSIWEDFSSKMLLILRTLLAGIIRRETDAVLRIKLARTSTKLLEKPKIFGDHPDFSPPWKDILELLEDFHVRSFDGPTFIGKEVREQHLRSLVALLLCFRYYFDASCEESIFSHPLFRSVSSGTLSDSSIPLFDTLNCEDPVKALEQVATVSLIVPFHSPCILSWVPDAVSFWMKINNSHDWDRLWLRLTGRIAKQQPHAIDWTPYMHKIYDRILSCLQISTREGARRSHSVIKTPSNVSCLVRGDSVSSAAEFLVYSLSPMNPSSLDLFLQLLQIIEPFYHPSHLEHGRNCLATFLSCCSRNLLHRTSAERKATRDNVVQRIQGSRTTTAVAPTEHRLTEQWIESIVCKLYGLAEYSLYSKSFKYSHEAANCIGNLCAILPEMIVPKVVSTAQDDFMSVTMPHRTKASLKALNVICPVICDVQMYSQGLEYVVQLLPYLLFCVDVNDTTKTKLAIDIVIALSPCFGQLLDEQPQIMEDFVLQWIERILHFLENMETPAKLGHAKVSALNFDTFGTFCEMLFQNCPPSLMHLLCEKVSNRIASPCSEALKHYGIMVYWIAKTCSSSCVDSLFIRRLLLPLQDATQPHQLVKNGSDEEIYANLRLIASAVRGYADSSYLRNVFQVALAAMKETNRKLYKAGSRLLRSLLEGLCSTTLANHWDSTRTNQHWTIPTHWDMAVEFIEQTLEFLDSNTFIGEEELLNDEMCKERIFSAARTLHALQRGGRWLLAGAQVDEENCSTLSPFKRPLYAGMFGEMNAKLAAELWKKIFQRILQLLEMGCKYFPDNAMVLYRMLSPVEMGNEGFRLDSRLGRVSNQAKNYKHSMQAWIIAKYGTNQVGKNMPLVYHRWRMECLHRKRQGYCAKGGYTNPLLVDALLQHVMKWVFSDFRKVRSRARNALIGALRLTPFVQRWKYVETLFQYVHSLITTGEEEKMIACLELLQDVFLIRFVTKHYYLMRKLIHVVLHCCKVTQRQDVVLALSSLFGKFLSHIRPLAVFSVAENESQDITRHGNSREQLQSILDMLYLQVFSSESLIWNGNWKVQAFVFSLLYAFYSPDCSIPEEYRIPLAKYLCSQVMIVRAIVQRMIHLILQICSNAEKAEWKGILSHLFSDESFEQSLLRTLYQDLSIYDAAEQTNGPSPSDATTMTLAFSFFADSVDAWTCWIVDGGEPWPRGYFERPNNDWISLRHVRFLSRLFAFVDTQLFHQVYQVALLDQVVDQFATCKVKHLVLGEWTVAMVINLDNTPYALEWMKQLLSCFVDADSLNAIETLFRLRISLGRNQTCDIFLKSFWEYLLNTLSPSDSWNHSSLNDARHLRTLFALLADQLHHDLDPPIQPYRVDCHSLVDLLTESTYLSHDFEQVREEVARLLCCLILDRRQSNVTSKIVNQLSFLLQDLRKQVELDDQRKKQLSNTRHTLSLLVLQCTHTRVAAHPLLDSQWVQIWLPLLFQAKEDSDVDVAARATDALSRCARDLIPSSSMESWMMEMCRANLHASSFKVRGGTVAFFQMWIFFHFFCLSHVVALQEILLEYLFDESLEVREAASRCFISLACLNSMDVLDKWSGRLMDILEKDNGNVWITSRQDESKIRLRHGAVLGASALILSHPFTILPWMPSLLVQVAYCIHDVPPISTCVRTMFSEFWRSHHDEWSKQKQMFEPLQLEALEELLIAPCYYA